MDIVLIVAAASLASRFAAGRESFEVLFQIGFA